MPPPESTRGIILRTYPLTESSLIVRWVSEEHGRISTVAKGARRDKSTMRGKLDLFFECEFSYRPSLRSDLHQLSEVKILKSRSDLRLDYSKLKQASYWVNILEATTEVETPLDSLYDLSVEYLDALLQNPFSPIMPLALELRWLSEMGWAPEITQTAVTNPELRQRLLELQSADWDVICQQIWSQTTYSAVRSMLTNYWRTGPGIIPKHRDTSAPSSLPKE